VKGGLSKNNKKGGGKGKRGDKKNQRRKKKNQKVPAGSIRHPGAEGGVLKTKRRERRLTGEGGQAPGEKKEGGEHERVNCRVRGKGELPGEKKTFKAEVRKEKGESVWPAKGER